MVSVIVLMDYNENNPIIIGVATNFQKAFEMLVTKHYIESTTICDYNINKHKWETLYEKFGDTWEEKFYEKGENFVCKVLGDNIQFSYFELNN